MFLFFGIVLTKRAKCFEICSKQHHTKIFRSFQTIAVVVNYDKFRGLKICGNSSDN